MNKQGTKTKNAYLSILRSKTVANDYQEPFEWECPRFSCLFNPDLEDVLGTRQPLHVMSSRNAGCTVCEDGSLLLRMR